MSITNSWNPSEYISLAALVVATMSLLYSFSAGRKQHKFNSELARYQNMQEFYALLNKVVGTKNKADVNIKQAIGINKKAIESIKLYKKIVTDEHYMGQELSDLEEFETILEERRAKVDEWDETISSMWNYQEADQKIWQALNQLNSVLNAEITQIAPLLLELENKKNTLLDSFNKIEKLVK